MRQPRGFGFGHIQLHDRAGIEADVQGLSVRSSIMILLAGFPAGTFPQMAFIRLVKSGHSVLRPFETDGTRWATTRLCRVMTTTSPSSIHRRILPRLCCTSRTVVVFTLDILTHN